MGHGLDHAESVRLAQHLIVPERLAVRVQEEVRVALDEPGDQRGAGQLDTRGAGGGADVLGRADRLDAVAADHNDPPGVGRVEHAVPHRLGNDHRGRGRRVVGA
jgi:hypothetical protein